MEVKIASLPRSKARRLEILKQNKTTRTSHGKEARSWIIFMTRNKLKECANLQAAVS